MKDDLREVVARALLIHRGLDPDWFFERHPGATVVHDEANAAIAAARPVIGEECAVIADAEAALALAMHDSLSDDAKADWFAKHREAVLIAAAIRSATR